MDAWETLIVSYPVDPEPRAFRKALKSVATVLKEDLASFEIEWILETLLHKPVELLRTVSLKRNDDAWCKDIGDAFKLLGQIVTYHHDNAHMYLKDIVDLCMLNYDATTRGHALECLSKVATVSQEGARDFQRNFISLQDSEINKAALVSLVGTICEHHPVMIGDNVNKLWRVLLNLLDSNKNTLKIKSSILKAILGFFKHFSSELPMMELNGFYEDLAAKHIYSCEEVCLTILAQYAELFRERLSVDVRLRCHLWSVLQNSDSARGKTAALAVRSVYRAVNKVVRGNALQKILDAEVTPKALSPMSKVKYTALRILSACGHDRCTHLADTLHIYETELSTAEISHDTAEAILWCIEANVPESDRLLQTAILFYTNIPEYKIKEILVYGILQAPSEIRTAAITFLASESCQQLPEQESNLNRYLPLWKRLFDAEDAFIVERCRLVFEDYMRYFVFVLDNFLEESTDDTEDLPQKLLTLLHLTSHVLTLQQPEEYTNDICCTCIQLLIHCASVCHTYEVISAVRQLARHVEGMEVVELYKLISIDKCKDEATLCETCLTIVCAPEGVDIETDVILAALQIIFRRNDVEASMLSVALKKLEQLMLTHNRDTAEISDILLSVEKLQSSSDLVGKDGRILRRDITLFLGKFGHYSDINNNTSSSDDIMLAKLKDSLSLNIFNTVEAVTHKINLQRILQLAIIHEDPNSLQTLLVIICAELCTNKSWILQHMLARVTQALSRVHVSGHSVNTEAFQLAVTLCDSPACLQGFLNYISEEKSPGVRKMVSDALEAVIIKNPSSEAARTLSDHAVTMMASCEDVKKKAGLDLMETLAAVLEKNNELAIKYLPEIIILIPKTNQADMKNSFNLATTLLINKIELFKPETVNEVIEKLISGLQEEILQRRNFKIAVKITLEFIKKLYDYRKEGNAKICHVFFETAYFENGSTAYMKSLFIVASIRNIFDLNLDVSRNVISTNDMKILVKLYGGDVKQLKSFDLQAVLSFMMEYAEVLLELQYQKTTDFLGKIIKNLTPNTIIESHKYLSICINIYKTQWRNFPQIIQSNFENWCIELPLTEITKNIDKSNFENCVNNANVVKGLNIMLHVFDIKNKVLLKEKVHKWPEIILRLYATEFIENHLKSKMSYLSDILSVSLKFCTSAELKKLILEGTNIQGMSNERVGIRFCKFFINAFAEVLLQKPFLLCDDDMGPASVVVNDLVKFLLKKKCTTDLCHTILELIGEIWPRYEANTNFYQKYSLLLDMRYLPERLPWDSNPMQWATNLLTTEQTSHGDKARLIVVLPGGHEYSNTYKSFASALPVRLSELKDTGRTYFRALLDSFASNKDLCLLDILLTIIDADETQSWWDDAIETCVAVVTTSSDDSLSDAIYHRCWDGLAMGICRRVLVPFLRYSTSSFCERFFTTHLQDLLTKFKDPKAPSGYHYQKYLVDCTKASSMMQIAFEKIPVSTLKDPNSTIFSKTAWDNNMTLIRKMCSICVTLQARPLTCEDGDVKEMYRKFQCALYKCLSAAICCSRPSAKVYTQLFKPNAWSKMVDEDEHYKLPLTNQRYQRLTRHPVSIEVRKDSTSTLRSATTVRTKLFLGTLSENPLQYDLVHDDSNVVVTQDLQLTHNELNNHECAATFTAVLHQASALEQFDWKQCVAQPLMSSLHRNAKWFVAETIANCKEDLKPHAGALRSALLAVVANTLVEHNGKKVLNALHVDILQTLIYWNSETSNEEPVDAELDITHLNTIIESIISTVIENRHRDNIYKGILDVLDKTLKMYGRFVTIPWSVLEPHVHATSDSAAVILKILLRIMKNKIHLPEALPTILMNFETNKCPVSKLSELFGAALSACTDNNLRSESLSKYRDLLTKMRKANNNKNYIHMLCYAQVECCESCDRSNFRHITNLVQKVVSYDKAKCLKIISLYLKNECSANGDLSHVTDMFETIDLRELVSGDSGVEAMEVVSRGVAFMKESMKRSVVLQISDICFNPTAKVRKAAFEVMMAALNDIINPKQTTSSAAKRHKSEYPTHLLSQITSTDVYVKTVMACVGFGVMDQDSDIASVVRNALCEHLCKDDITVRFSESFLVTTYFPILLNKSSNGKYTIDMRVCSSAILDLTFSFLKSQERFKKIKLRDAPIDISDPQTQLSRVLTKSKTYQGTFSKRTKSKAKELNTAGIDVQMTIDSILGTFLDFTKVNSEAAQALLLDVVTSLLSRDDLKFDISRTIFRMLNNILENSLVDVTTFVMLARLVLDSADDVECLLPAVEKLRKITIGSESEHIVKLLYEEIKMQCCDATRFVLGSLEDVNYDIEMAEDSFDFSLQDLVAAFGKLSNWDDMTLQDKAKVEQTGLPMMWTDEDTFKFSLDEYTEESSWFGKMVSSLQSRDRVKMMKWCRDIERWPRRRFEVSAITEMLCWHTDEAYLDKIPVDIQPNDCLAEWAARLLIRRTYLSSLECDDSEVKDKRSRLSRLHALRWCTSANERALNKLALDCVEDNVNGDIFESETLAWLRQNLIALRELGLKNDDKVQLKEALDKAETYTPEFMYNTTPAEVVGMKRLILKLKNDLNLLSSECIRPFLHDLTSYYENNKQEDINIKDLAKIYEMAMTFYDSQWEECLDSTEKNALISDMSDVLGHAADLNRTNCGAYVAIILNRLADFTGTNALSDATARNLLEKVTHVIEYLDKFCIDELKNAIYLFPKSMLKSFGRHITKFLADDVALDKYKKYFQLVSYPEYLLKQYCEHLLCFINDITNWTLTFDRLKSKIFENPYRGTDYLILDKYKDKLYGICDYELTEEFKRKAKTTLIEMLKDLCRVDQSTLKLSQLCPALSKVQSLPGAGRLLGLATGEDPVNICEQITQDAYVCSDCFKILNDCSRHLVYNEDKKDAKQFVIPARDVGHKAVCSCCGISVLRKRSVKLSDETPEKKYLIKEIYPHEVCNFITVCWRCILRAKRALKDEIYHGKVVVKIEKFEETEALIIGETHEICEYDESTKSCFNDNKNKMDIIESKHKSDNNDEKYMKPIIYNNDQVLENFNDKIKSNIVIEYSNTSDLHCLETRNSCIIKESGDPADNLSKVENLEEDIILKKYKRVANTSNKCAYLNCKEKKLHTPSSILRKTFLIRKKIFLPPKAKMCENHKNKENHEDSLNAKFSHFNSEFIENIINMLVDMSKTVLDFSHTSDMTPKFSDYWIGLSSEQFLELMSFIPELHHFVPDAEIALSSLLVKFRTGDSCERLEVLFGVNRKTIVRYMESARKLLMSKFVPVYLDINTRVDEILASWLKKDCEKAKDEKYISYGIMSKKVRLHFRYFRVIGRSRKNIFLPDELKIACALIHFKDKYKEPRVSRSKDQTTNLALSPTKKESETKQQLVSNYKGQNTDFKLSPRKKDKKTTRQPFTRNKDQDIDLPYSPSRKEKNKNVKNDMLMVGHKQAQQKQNHEICQLKENSDTIIRLNNTEYKANTTIGNEKDEDKEDEDENDNYEEPMIYISDYTTVKSECLDEEMDSAIVFETSQISNESHLVTRNSYIVREQNQNGEQELATNGSNMSMTTVQTILNLKEYKRVASTSSRCAYINCKSRERHRIPLHLKIKALVDNKIYITDKARACFYHVDKNDSNGLNANITEFNLEHIEDMLNMLHKNAKNALDFSFISDMKPKLVEYWTGLMPKQFSELLSFIPEIRDVVPDASVALSSLLIKLQTGDSLERIGTILNLDRKRLVKIMDKTTKLLMIKFVPVYFDVNTRAEEILASWLKSDNEKANNEKYVSYGIMSKRVRIYFRYFRLVSKSNRTDYLLEELKIACALLNFKDKTQEPSPSKSIFLKKKKAKKRLTVDNQSENVSSMACEPVQEATSCSKPKKKRTKKSLPAASNQSELMSSTAYANDYNIATNSMPTSQTGPESQQCSCFGQAYQQWMENIEF